MGRFGRGGSTPRVVGFDFAAPPAATPWTEGAAPPAYEPQAAYEPPPSFDPPAAYDPPVAEAPAYAPPQYPPPAYPPPAYPPPAVGAQAGEPYAAPVATLAPPQVAPGWGVPQTTTDWGAPQPAYPPAPSWTPAPAPGRRMSRQTLRAGASILVALGLFAGRVALRTMGDDDVPTRSDVTLHTPATLGGLPRQTSEEARAAERSAARDVPAFQQPTVAGYGRGTMPTYYLVAGIGPEESAKAVLRGFTKGFEEGGGTVGAAKAMPGGVWCAPVTVLTARGGVCAWASDVSDGVVMQYDKTDLAKLAKVTAQARTGVNGG